MIAKIQSLFPPEMLPCSRVNYEADVPNLVTLYRDVKFAFMNQK